MDLRAPFWRASSGSSDGTRDNDRPTIIGPGLPRLLALLTATVGGLLLVAWLFETFFTNPTTYGLQDWDISSVYRYTPLVHLLKYHEGPWWNPWMCGGVPDWGYVEGATNVVSPYLPAYLAFSLPVAERLEVVGSTVVAFISTWLLAGRATSLLSLRFFCAIVYALNGRWAMQATVGHTWHLQYAWTPLVLYLLVRSIEEQRWTWAAWGGATLALTVYDGGVYPLPHTALLVGAFGVVYAIATRSLRPLLMGGVVGLVAFGLSAPKLLPVVLTMRRFPREIDSIESMKISELLTTLVAKGQTITHGPIEISPYHWHEYGTYVGWPVVVALGIFFLCGWGRLETGLRIVALVLFALSLGDFARFAPWAWLHRLPVFSSQHVPSRFTQTGLLVAAFGLCFLAERWSLRLRGRRAWLDLLLLMPVLWIGRDIVANDKPSVDRAFRLQAPEVTATAEFHHEERSTEVYPAIPKRGSMLLATYANVGVLKCYGYPPRKDIVGGAIASRSKDGGGEAFLLDTLGKPVAASASIAAWTPNSATVRVREPRTGELLVYNMNTGPGWSANGRPAIESEGRVAARLVPGETVVTFSYSPPGLKWGLAVCLLTIAGCLGALWRSRRQQANASSVG